MKKTFLALGTMALLASPSLFAVEATKTQSSLTTQLKSQQRLHNGIGMGGKKQIKHQYNHQYKYQGTNSNMQGNGNAKGTGQGKGQGSMSGQGQGKGQGNRGGSGMRGGKGGGGGGKR